MKNRVTLKSYSGNTIVLERNPKGHSKFFGLRDNQTHKYYAFPFADLKAAIGVLETPEPEPEPEPEYPVGTTMTAPYGGYWIKVVKGTTETAWRFVANGILSDSVVDDASVREAESDNFCTIKVPA